MSIDWYNNSTIYWLHNSPNFKTSKKKISYNLCTTYVKIILTPINLTKAFLLSLTRRMHSIKFPPYEWFYRSLHLLRHDHPFRAFTLSHLGRLRELISCYVRSYHVTWGHIMLRELISCYACSWDVRGDLIIHHLVYITLCRVPLWPAYQTATYTVWYIPGDVLIQLILLKMSTRLLETCR